MRTRLWCSLLFVTLTSALCAAPEIEFSGVLSTPAITKISLTDKSAGVSRWLAVGDMFAGYRLAAFDAHTEIVTLERDGTSVQLHLVIGKVQDEQAKIHEAILENLRTLVTAANRFYLDNGRANAKFADLVGAGKSLPELIAIDGEDYNALMFLVSAKSFSVTTPHGLTVTYEPSEPAAVPREIILRAGDSLAKIARDSGVPLADLMALNPDADAARLRIGQKLRLKQ